MKRIFFSILLLTHLCSICATNIDYEFLRILTKTGIICFEADFSNASIHGMSEDVFAEYESDWEKDKPQIISKFLDEFTEQIGGQLRLVRNEDDAIILRWSILHINKNGDIKSELHIVDQNKIVKTVIPNIKGSGGTFGSKLNLIKDGAEECGKNAGKILKRELKKAKK